LGVLYLGGTGFVTPSLTFSNIHSSLKRYGRGNMPRPALRKTRYLIKLRYLTNENAAYDTHIIKSIHPIKAWKPVQSRTLKIIILEIYSQ
jgi:hypothetical protein